MSQRRRKKEVRATLFEDTEYRPIVQACTIERVSLASMIRDLVVPHAARIVAEHAAKLVERTNGPMAAHEPGAER